MAGLAHIIFIFYVRAPASFEKKSAGLTVWKVSKYKVFSGPYLDTVSDVFHSVWQCGSFLELFPNLKIFKKIYPKFIG